jgi:hypothetical protein
MLCLAVRALQNRVLGREFWPDGEAIKGEF